VGLEEKSLKSMTKRNKKEEKTQYKLKCQWKRL
jgi:hypothetical protein